ncbi:MAG TPA: GAF domain-containing protein [Fibrobacteria bacterium]|nr:GAF domain-containing protein [Fibrobacteria bacterium]
MATTSTGETLKGEIRDLLLKSGDTDTALETVLGKLLEAFQCQVGTIHTLDQATGMLTLRARRGIPESILDKVRMIPIGKGMAGIAAERMRPVQVCNLQTDASGVAKPGAKDTKMEGSISAPMILDGKLKGTLGVAKPVPYEFSEAESALLLEAGTLIAGFVK